MGKIIEAIYNGDLYPAEMPAPATPESRELERKISAIREALMNQLSEKGAAQLEEYDDLNTASSALSIHACFASGFRLGALLMCEIHSER